MHVLMKRLPSLLLFAIIGCTTTVYPGFVVSNVSEKEIEIRAAQGEDKIALKTLAEAGFIEDSELFLVAVGKKTLDSFYKIKNKYLAIGILSTNGISYVILENKATEWWILRCGGSYYANIYFDENKVWVSNEDAGDSASELLVEKYP